jgi:pimeloyl-ACP methyl ester carboxylesterase
VRHPDERIAKVGEIELAYEELGDPDGEPLLLVMGLATQMVGWPEGFCGLLGERGYRVIRYDNRDIGHSTKLEGAGRPGRGAMLFGVGEPAYLLEDLADDAAGLLDALGISSAHVVGASMGGMIAQVLAIRHPEKVRSLASIMSGPGSRWSRMPRLRALGSLLQAAPSEREAFVEHAVKTFSVIGSPGFERDEGRLRETAALSYDRSYYPPGVARQLHAITASPSRTRDLRTVRAPTVVIHGKHDPLVRLAAGRATARAIPGARLVVIDGMGHDLPEGAWGWIVDEIDANARRAGEGAPAAPAEAHATA